MEIITQFAWVGWLVLIALFLAIEIISGELTFLMLGLGGTAGLIASFAGAPVWLQVIIAAAAAAAFLFLLRPSLVKRLRRGADPQKFNVEGLVGLRGVVTETVTGVAGRVKLVNGDSWSARVTAGSDLPPNSSIVVQSIQGATALVVPIEES